MNDAVAQRLAELQHEYASALPERIATVRAHWEALQQGGDYDQACNGLVRTVHGLSGSGGSFGCESLSDAARRLEEFLESVSPEHLVGEGVSAFERLFADLVRASRECGDRLGRALNKTASSCLGEVATGSEQPLIYIVEDDTSFATRLTTQLHQDGFTTRVFPSGEGLVTALGESPQAAVLVIDVDVEEQRFDGIEILVRLRRENAQKIPAIILSARDDFESRLAAARAGSTHYLGKPVDMHRLVSLLNLYSRGDRRAGYRLMLVDDDAEVAELFRPELEAAGIQVRIATDPTQAMNAIQAFDPELILLDIRMPGISGQELAAVLRQNDAYAQVPIVFLSSERDRDRQLAAMNLGGDDFLAKPITPDLLLAAVLPRLRRARSVREAMQRAEIAFTELRQHQAALDEHAIVSVTSLSGNILYANKKFCEISGYSLDELLGQNHRLINSGYHPREFFVEMWETISAGTVWNGIIRNRSKDGRFYWVESTIVPLLDRRGRPSQYVSIRTDITPIMEADQRLHESETRLSDAHRIARLGDYDYDISGNRLVWSDTVFELLGLVPGSVQPSLEAFFARVHPDDADRVREQMIAILIDANPPGTARSIQLPGYDFRVVHPDGKVLWLHSEGVASVDETGHPFHVHGTVQDMTAHKSFEQELVRAREQAEAASRTKSQFLASMSHELRTPLNAILGFAQLLNLDPEHVLSSQQKEGVEQILSSGWHLVELINDVLDLSKLDNGAVQLDLVAIDIAQLVDECQKILQPLAAKHRVDMLKYQCACRQPYLHADRLRLKQVLLNVLANAIKYNRPQGTVVVRCEERGERLRILVKDSGPGLSDEQQRDLFKAFNRLGREGETIEGTGIGLFLSRRLVEMMGGVIGVESRVGEGSTFWIELDHAEPVGPRATVPAVMPDLAGSGQAILYIEDNETNIRLVEKIVERLSGMRLLLARKGKEGIECARQVKPSLILLDMNLPDMHGLDVLATLQQDERTQSLPVFILSADGMPEVIASARNAGASRYFTKPLDIRAFQEAIRQVVVPPQGRVV